MRSGAALLTVWTTCALLPYQQNQPAWCAEILAVDKAAASLLLNVMLICGVDVMIRTLVKGDGICKTITVASVRC